MERLAFMNCSLCGEVCRCPSEPLPTAVAQWSPEAESGSASSFVDLLETKMNLEVARPGGEVPDSRNVPPHNLPTHIVPPQEVDATAWRDELSARLSRYRARRKVRPPRYPSLGLQFEEVEWSTRPNALGGSGPVPAFESVSNHALALDEMRHGPCSTVETDVESEFAPAAEAAPPPVHRPAGNLAGLSSGHPLDMPAEQRSSSFRGLPGDRLLRRWINSPSRSASARESWRSPRLRRRLRRWAELPLKRPSTRKPRSGPESTSLCKARRSVCGCWLPWSMDRLSLWRRRYSVSFSGRWPRFVRRWRRFWDWRQESLACSGQPTNIC